MKTYLMIIFHFISTFTVAQDNPYCPCQEEAHRQQELQLVFEQMQTQTFLYVPQQPRPQAIPVSVPRPANEMRRINVKPQIEVPIIEEKEEILPVPEVEESENEVEIPEIEAEEIFRSPTERSVGTGRAKLKTRKKWLLKRVKKKKRKRRYRGRCPRF